MNEFYQSEQVRHAVDTRLSGLKGNPWTAKRVLIYAKGETKVKKKLSAGLVLTIVIILLVVGAAAAVILSMREIVEEQAIPMANQYEGESYTAEDTNLLLSLAEENGIELSQQAKAQIQRALDQEEGYFKEELLMALAKAEFGENPAVWTLEQQKWFDDVCVAIGFISEPEKAMPSGGEEAKDPIVKAAIDYIHKTYDPDLPLDDPAKFEMGVQYINGGKHDEYQGLYWSIDYSPLYLEGGEYWVYLRDDGTVLGDSVHPGLNQNSTVRDVYHNYQRIFGWDFTTRDQSTLRSFLADAAKASDTSSKAYLCFLRTTYPDIPEDAISQEQAFAIAAEYLGVDQTLGRSQLLLIGDEPNPVWKLYIVQDDDYWSAEVDCVTGEIKTTLPLDNMHKRWWMRMVLWKTVDEVDKVWVDDSPPAVG